MDTKTVKAHQIFNSKFLNLLYKTKWFRLVLSFISGLLLFISFPPLSYGLFCWIALIPLIVAIFSSPSWKAAGICGLVTGIVFYSASLSFMFDVFGLIGLMLANSFSIYIALFAVSSWICARKIGLRKTFWLIPVFWAGIEYFRSEVYILKFPWLALGYSQSPNLSLIQVCDIIGVYGLSFLIVLTNELVAWCIIKRLRENIWTFLQPIIAIGVIIIILIYGLFRYQYTPKYKRTDSTPTIPVAVVQKWNGSLENYIRATRESVNSRRETIVVWPESAVKEALSDLSNRNLIEALAKDNNLYLIFGTYEPTEDIVRFHNLVAIFSPDGTLMGKYAKRITVPFIETVVKPGDKWGIFDTSLGKIGILICYEAGFSNLATMLVRRKGIEILVVPTLEVGEWGGLSHKHHASMMPIRAVEIRRPILRSSVLGISMIVHPSGKIEGQLNYLASGVLRSEILKSTEMTLYVKYGYIIPRLCLYIYALLVALVIILFLINQIPGGERIINYLKFLPKIFRVD